MELTDQDKQYLLSHFSTEQLKQLLVPELFGGLHILESDLDAGNDMVDHPSHYTNGQIECIEAIEASMPKEEFVGYLKGNVLKYVWRYDMKGWDEDLRKARWYLDLFIDRVSNMERKS